MTQDIAQDIALIVGVGPGLGAALGRRFVALHERLYGYATDEPWQLEAIRMRAAVPQRRGWSGAPATARAAAQAVKTRPCVFDAAGPVPTPRYRRDDIGAGQTIAGPAIVEDASATIVIPPGASASADDHGHLHIETGVSQ